MPLRWQNQSVLREKLSFTGKGSGLSDNVGTSKQLGLKLLGIYTKGWQEGQLPERSTGGANKEAGKRSNSRLPINYRPIASTSRGR